MGLNGTVNSPPSSIARDEAPKTSPQASLAEYSCGRGAAYAWAEGCQVGEEFFPGMARDADRETPIVDRTEARSLASGHTVSRLSRTTSYSAVASGRWRR
jgi:hypothetical protein